MRTLALTLALSSACVAPGLDADPRAGEFAPPPAPSSLQLAVSALIPGQPAVFTLRGLQPGERGVVLRSNRLSAGGACPAVLGGLCLDLAGPLTTVGSDVADASGVVRLTIQLPATAPTGREVALQGAVIRGPGGVDSASSDAQLLEIGAPVAGPSSLLAGDLVITEILKDPTAVADADGEWFEVLNASGVTVDLAGLEISDRDGDAFVVDRSVVVPAGGFAVFGAEDDPALNGGVAVDFEWSRFTLANGADEIALGYAGVVFDEVAWDDGVTFPDAAGRSLALDYYAQTAQGNDDGGWWCDGAPSSPGQENPACPNLWCGDGWLDPGETCDDGGAAAGDGCDEVCQIE